MTWDRAEIISHTKGVTRAVASRQAPLQALERQAVLAKHLTGAEHWDVYLSYLQAAIDREEKAAEALRAAILSPQTVEADKIVRLKIDLAGREAAIRAWKSAIEIPAMAIRDGEAAKQRIETMLEAVGG